MKHLEYFQALAAAVTAVVLMTMMVRCDNTNVCYRAGNGLECGR